ncbi:DNA glycosylase AlkZ-like family protein [Amycolatopsis sp. ATCC 39116]|uniref:DNA glycosylase AlkZ-like family protein n=1 Tax=Amycolatopsis sp. (strain ATCC 39116 / 75iv2) TaxID=385957 RepID=UPI00026271EB|nr:crosslink repair DNA glycosylase YcaQ family protein [Amycolatopsis sp. ATCC 39116]
MPDTLGQRALNRALLARQLLLRRTKLTPLEAVRVFGVPNGVFPGTVLVDGLVRGSWRITRSQAGAALEIEPYGRVSKKDREALESAGARLVRFAVGEDACDIRFAPLA